MVKKIYVIAKHWHVTDRQTDRWTDIVRQHSPRYAQLDGAVIRITSYVDT